MKSIKALLVLFLFTAAIMVGAFAQQKQEVWKAPERASHKKNPVASDDKSIAAGKETYTKLCEKCHGVTGKGDGPKAKQLEKKPGDLSDPKLTEQSDGALFWKLTTGKKPMPSVEKKLTEEQRWQVINYVRTFAGKSKVN